MLEQFAKDLLAQKGLDKVDPAVYADLIDELILKSNEFINNRLLDSLNDSQYKEFEELVSTSQDESVIQHFFDANVPNKNGIAASALLEFKSLYLGAV